MPLYGSASDRKRTYADASMGSAGNGSAGFRIACNTYAYDGYGGSDRDHTACHYTSADRNHNAYHTATDYADDYYTSADRNHDAYHTAAYHTAADYRASNYGAADHAASDHAASDFCFGQHYCRRRNDPPRHDVDQRS